MKKKLGLLLVSVISTMSMIMGMSTMAYAAEWEPQTIDCGNDGHESIVHFYVDTTETYVTLIGDVENVNVSGWYLKYMEDDGKLKVFDERESSGTNNRAFRANFPENLETGWYYETSDGKFHKCPPPVVEAEPSSAAHTHDYHWQTIVEPTKDQDGLESEVCVCGATRNIQRIPAMGFTLTEYATPMVVNAIPGQTVEMEFGEWNSFPKSFMEKVAAKTQQNVSFGFHYNWNHVGQEIRIPAGTKVDTNFDWYGPAKMQELYGQN